MQLISLLRVFERQPFVQPHPVLFAFYHCMKLSSNLVNAAKDKEVVGMLIGLIGTLKNMAAEDPSQNTFLGKDLNLNRLISLGNYVDS